MDTWEEIQKSLDEEKKRIEHMQVILKTYQLKVDNGECYCDEIRQVAAHYSHYAPNIAKETMPCEVCFIQKHIADGCLTEDDVYNDTARMVKGWNEDNTHKGQ